MTNLGQIEMLIGTAYKTNLTRTLELLSRGIDPNSPGKWGRTALPIAVRYAYQNLADAIQIVAALISAGADVNASPGDTISPIRNAAIYHYTEVLHFLIRAGADPNDRDSLGQTVISMIESTPTLKLCRRRIVKILEEAGGVR